MEKQKVTQSASSPLRPDLMKVTPENVEELFTYAPWDETQKEAGKAIREQLVETAREIMAWVPESPSRTRALNMLIDCRMLVNAAITHHGVVIE